MCLASCPFCALVSTAGASYHRNGCAESKTPGSQARVLDVKVPLPTLFWPAMGPYLSVQLGRPITLVPNLLWAVLLNPQSALSESWLLDLFELTAYLTPSVCSALPKHKFTVSYRPQSLESGDPEGPKG